MEDTEKNQEVQEVPSPGGLGGASRLKRVAPECDDCGERGANLMIRLTNMAGEVLDERPVCAQCAKQAGLQPGAVR